jgi:hypothetical protein
MLYRAKSNEDVGVKGCKIIGNDTPIGYELTETFFVDNSGFGASDELALTFSQFLTKVKAGYFYGIKEVGQFQVYINEFKKVSKPRSEILSEQGIVSSKLIKNNTRLTIYKNGDKVLRLHLTDIIKWQGNKIILNSGGWDTHTTRARFNEFLPDGISVYREKAITYINVRGAVLEFYDGIEL